MTEKPRRIATPQEIMNFLRDVVGEKTKIEPTEDGSGFQICTDMGASFTFEITRATENEVARAYFDHCCQVCEYGSKQFIRGGGGFLVLLFFGLVSRKERRAAARQLEILQAWRANNL